MSRETLKSLVDNIDESELDTLYRIMIRFIAEEPALPDEEESIRSAHVDFKKGDTYTHEEVWA